MSEKDKLADVELISALAALLRENDLTEIEVNRNYSEDVWVNVRVARQNVVETHATIPAPAAAPVAAIAPSAPAPVPNAPAATPPVDPADDPGVVPSPMVGTVYLQAEPGAPAFVSIGDSVAEGQTILIIEAMKTMNQIAAPRAGRVKRILVENGAPVEFGAPLIILE